MSGGACGVSILTVPDPATWSGGAVMGYVGPAGIGTIGVLLVVVLVLLIGVVGLVLHPIRVMRRRRRLRQEQAGTDADVAAAGRR